MWFFRRICEILGSMIASVPSNSGAAARAPSPPSGLVILVRMSPRRARRFKVDGWPAAELTGLSPSKSSY
ncbi:hypothetical protein VTK26DRAFT_6053 [Humicola hyalothermophila]